MGADIRHNAAADDFEIVTAAEGTQQIAAKLSQASSPTVADKDLTPSATVGDGQNTGITITNKPVGGSYVRPEINGGGYSIGDGVKTKVFYFSNDAGVTARAFSAIVAGDALFFNGLVAGFDLASSDRLNLYYNT